MSSVSRVPQTRTMAGDELSAYDARTTLRRTTCAGSGNELALWVGLAVALGALTTSMGQVERGANRI